MHEDEKKPTVNDVWKTFGEYLALKAKLEKPKKKHWRTDDKKRTLQRMRE